MDGQSLFQQKNLPFWWSGIFQILLQQISCSNLVCGVMRGPRDSLGEIFTESMKAVNDAKQLLVAGG